MKHISQEECERLKKGRKREDKELVIVSVKKTPSPTVSYYHLWSYYLLLLIYLL